MITWACQKNTIGHHAGWGQVEIQPFCSRRITGDSGGGGVCTFEERIRTDLTGGGMAVDRRKYRRTVIIDENCTNPS